MELGPCSINGPPKKGSNGTEWNPYSWNNKANLFFLDQVCTLYNLPWVGSDQFIAVREVVGRVFSCTEIHMQSWGRV